MHVNPFGPFRREHTSGGVTVYEYERGLMYRCGKLERVLEAGYYRLWPWSGCRLVVVDVRRTHLHGGGHKVLTADQVPATLHLSADYEVSDVVAAVQRVVDFRGQLSRDLELAARAAASVPFEALLGQRGRLNDDILEAVRKSACGYGLHVHQAGLQDVVIAPQTRQRLRRRADAKRRGGRGRTVEAAANGVAAG